MKNLSPVVSNELLYKAFGIFGTIDTVKVLMNEKGDKSKGEGLVEFANKHSANDAIMACFDAPFVLTSSPVPVVVEPYEGVDDDDGWSEKLVNQKDPLYRTEREQGPRFIQAGTFDYKFCEKYKQLTELRKQKEEALEREMKIEEEKLWSQMEFARFEHETEFMKEQIRVREEERMRRIEMVSAREQDFQRRLEMEREQQKIRETMFDFNINNSQGVQSGMSGMMAAMGQSVMENMMGQSGGMEQMMGGGGMGPPAMNPMNPMMGMMAGGGMGGAGQDPTRMSAEMNEKFNPSIWEEFRGEAGSRPRYPGEVFGRGGSMAGRMAGRGDGGDRK